MKIHEYNDMMAYLMRPATGGRVQLADGTPVRFDETRVKIPTGKFVGEGRDRAEIFKIKNIKTGSVRYTAAGAGGGTKKLYNSIEEVKKAKLDFIPDELVKTGSKRIKENIQEVTYKNKKTGEIVTKYKPFIGPNKVTIEGQGANTLKEAEKFVDNYFQKNPKQVRVRDPKKDYVSKDERRKFEKLKQGRMIKFGAGKGNVVHHMLPLAGKADVTTSDLAKISAKMNAELAQFDKPMNKLVNEAYALDFSKEGSLKRMNEINKELEGYVNKSVKKLGPKYKGLLGFNKLTPVLDTFDEKGNQVFDEVPKGLDFKKSIAGKKQGEAIRNIKTKDIQEMVSKIKGITTADKIPTPEKTKTREMFQKAFNIGKTVSKPIVRAVAPFVPFLGTIGVGLGAADVAKAAEFTKKPDELGLAYLLGPDLARRYGDYKNRIRGMQDETEEFVP